MRQFYIFFTTLAMAFFFAGPSWACHFDGDMRPLQQRLDDYDTVFIGKVVDAQSEQGTGNSDAQLLVMEPIKGEPKEGETAVLASHMQSCSIRFQKDDIWLIATNGTTKPYEVNITGASSLIQESRGLPVNGWGIIKPLLTPEALARFSEKNKCAAASLALTDYFANMPRACKQDKDCSGFFINPFPCTPPIIARQDALKETQTLEALQKAALAACQLKTALIPACEPPPLYPVCYNGTCINKMPGQD